MNRIDRRHFLLGTGALAALTLAGCNASANSPGAGPSTSASSTGFSYTDARGKLIELATVPTVVVAQSSAAAALWDAGFKVKGAYGELKTTDGKLDFQAGNLDLSQITVLGSTWSEFDLEKYAALGPQLLIDMSFDNKELWYLTGDVATKAEAVAPSLGMRMLNRDLLQVTEAFVELAVKLGADPAVSAGAKTQFDAEVAKITANPRPDLKILVLSRDGEKLWLGNPGQHPDIAYLAKLGVQFVDPGGDDSQYFEEVSYEKIADYPADIIFDDSRGDKLGDPGPRYEGPATYQALPAVKNKQVYEWKPAAPYSYAASAPIFAEIAGLLAGAKKVT